MAINFPDSPSIGDQFETRGIIYEWSGYSWTTNTSITFIGNKIDSIFSKSNTAHLHANAAYVSQNTTGVYANAAYDLANTKFASVGGTVSGDMVVTGNLRVAGLTTYVSSTDLNIGDNIINLNADLAQDATPTESAGIQIERGIENNVAVLWDENIDKWVFTNDGSIYSQIASAASEVYANAAFRSQNTTGSYSNSAFIHANSAYDFANTLVAGDAIDNWSRLAVNAASSYSNSAFLHANAAYTSQNTTGVYANTVYAHANAAYVSQNTSGDYANSAYGQANTATSDAAQADQRAVTSGVYANSAFATANSKVSKSGDTINGTLTLVGGLSQSSGDVDIGGSTYQTVIAVPNLDIDCSQGNYFTKTISSTSTFTFSNVPSSRAYMFAIEITHQSGTINWPTSVKWPFDTPPTINTGLTHIFIFITDNGGTRWRGAALVDYVN
jgi:hypothetical protein